MAGWLPRAWAASGQPISIAQAPTRWGRVNYNLVARPEQKTVRAHVELAAPGAPKEIQVKLRLPKTMPLHGDFIERHCKAPFAA